MVAMKSAVWFRRAWNYFQYHEFQFGAGRKTGVHSEPSPDTIRLMTLSRLRYHLAASLMLMTLPLAANVLVPGGTVSPDVFVGPGNPPLLGDITGTFNLGSGALIGHWEEAVLVDPFSPPTVCGGCLDFAFQITVDSSAAGGGIFSANFGRFFGYTTDVGYITNS
jgi:hypothetical protein